MDSSELGTCSTSSTAAASGPALSPVRHGKGSWSSSAREHPWIIYLGHAVPHYILVTPTTQGLNPNAHVFESKLPSGVGGDCSAISWEESEPEAPQPSASPLTGGDPVSPLSLPVSPVMAGYHQYQDQDHHRHHRHEQEQEQPKEKGHANGDAAVGKLSGSAEMVLPCASTSTQTKSSDRTPTPTSEDMPYHGGTAPSPAPATVQVPTPEGDGDASPRCQQSTDGGGGGGFMPQDQLKAMLQQQLEYYFSRENLANDTYLLSQMDSDQYVPIWTVANFNQIKKLTKDLTLIVQVLRDSPNVQVDEAGEKVRPNHKRCIVILREIPESTPVEDVEALFKGENCPKFVSCEFAHNNSWYVTFESDEDAQRAYRYLREEVKCFQGKSIMARIKAKPITRASFLPKNGYRPAAVDSTAAAAYAQPRYAAFQPAAVPSVGYGGQQMPAVYAFPPFYPPNMLQAWAPTSHAYFDIGSVFSINGLAPQPAFKPLNGTGRSNFQVLRPRNPKGHPRNQANYERLDSRSGASHGTASVPTNGFASCPKGGSAKAGSLENGHAKRDPVACAGAGPGPGPATPAPSSPGVPHGPEAVQSPASSTGAESREDAALFNQADAQACAAAGLQPPRSRHRRRKKEDEGVGGTSRNVSAEVSKSAAATKDAKLPLPKFDLEAAAFPPLPGTTDAGGCDAEAFENRMSDVVRGTAKPPTRDSKTQTSAPPLSPSPVPTARSNERHGPVVPPTTPVVTNGDGCSDHAFTPPPSPTCPRAAKTLCDSTTTTTTERKERAEDDADPSAVAGGRLKIAAATSPARCSPSVPGSPTVNVSPDVPATVVSSKSPPNSISQECKTARLSYAQMAQRAKEKVEKMAQEQKERQGALDREHSHAKDARSLRERDPVAAKGPQRDRYPPDNRERYRRTKIAKDCGPNLNPNPGPATNQNSDDRDRRRDKIPNQGGSWMQSEAPQRTATPAAVHPAD